MNSDPLSIDELADDFASRCRRGESPTIEEYVRDYPELSDQISRLFPSILMMERLSEEEQLDRKIARTRATVTDPRVDQIGDYQIVREIGRGGMGIVYEAVQESLDRRVAVKVLARQSVLEEKHLRRFRREARTAARLHHSNIVPVFGVGEHAGMFYYVMQFIPGVGLDEILRELRLSSGSDPANCGSKSSAASAARALCGVSRAQVDTQSTDALAADTINGNELLNWDVPPYDQSAPTLTPEEFAAGQGAAERSAPSENEPQATIELTSDYFRNVARIGAQVAAALKYSHGQDTLHRDIKPANLLLDSNGHVWVTDFGLAKAIEHDDVSQPGDVVGTLRYMSAEQFAGQPDARSDLFSLGTTLYELLTLTPAFKDNIRQHLLADDSPQLQRPTAVNKSIPLDLETIVLKACAHNPLDRYQSAADLADDLQCFLEDRPIQARPISVVERIRRWCRRNPAIAALSTVASILLVLVAVVATAGYLYTSAALERESKERSRAQREKENAETTLGISLEALERIYRRFAPSRFIEPSQFSVENANGEQVELPAQPLLSKETAQLLQDILVFYDRFAQLDSKNLLLQAEAAKANRRVGDIQRRLGNYEQAERAYLSAIQRFQTLDKTSTKTYSTDIARIHNELGNVYRAWHRRDDSHRSFQNALDLLAESNKQSPAGTRFELARTLYFLGKRRFGPRQGPPRGRRGPPGHHPGKQRGRGPGGRGKGKKGGGRWGGPRRRGPGRRSSPSTDQHLDRAIVILTELREASTANQPEYAYLLALCHRERAHRADSPDEVAAINLLTELADRYPQVADYQYELSETYARVDVRRIWNDRLSDAAARLQKALEFARPLALSHPNMPDYAHSRAQANLKLGTIMDRQARLLSGNARQVMLEQAKLHLQEAVTIQTSLVKQFPKAGFDKLWLSRMTHNLARVLIGLGDNQGAKQISLHAIRQLTALVDTNEDGQGLWFVHHTLAQLNWLLVDVYQRLNDETSATAARQMAQQHEQSARPRGFGFGGRRGPFRFFFRP